MKAKERRLIRRKSLAAGQRSDKLALAIEFSSHKAAWQVSHLTAGLIDCGSIKYSDLAPDVAGKGHVMCLTGDVFSVPMLKVLAFDEVMRQVRASSRFENCNIGVLTGSNAQHESIYLNGTFEAVLGGADSSQPLADQLSTVFSRPTSVVWENSSTSESAERFASFLSGGDKAIAELTGAIPTLRFFGLAIDQFVQLERGRYDRTTHITLGCGLGTSLCLGKIGPLEPGDGAGGNLMDIRQRQWARQIVDAIDPGLYGKLPRIVDSNAVVGTVSEYLVRRYGFSANCKVLPWSGDNPASLLGRGIYSRKQRIRVNSKGTSETELAPLPADRWYDDTGAGAVFCCLTPDDQGQPQNFGINTFRNGTPALEEVMRRHSIGSFDEFRDILGRTPPGNDGQFMIALFKPEICPRVLEPTVRYLGGLQQDDRDRVVRAVVEFQAINRLLHSDRLGEAPEAYLATGGGGADEAIAQVDADVFDATVYLGSADFNTVNNGDCIRGLRALHPERSWEWLCDRHCAYGKAVAPQHPDSYRGLKDQLRTALAGITG